MTEELLDALIGRYKSLITCVCFMGGDADPEEVVRLARHINSSQLSTVNDQLKTAWYSGRPASPETYSGSLRAFDYVKFGPYIEDLGGLKSPTTNQRLYKRVGEEWEDITSSFWKKNL